MKKTLLISLISILSVNANASKEFHSGNDFVKDCKFSVSAKRMFCLGIVTGAHSAATGVAMAFWQKPLFCTTQSYTHEKGIDITVKYIEDNPHEAYLHSGSIVSIALLDAYPCKR